MSTPQKRAVLIAAVTIALGFWCWHRSKPRRKTGIELLRDRNRGMHSAESVFAGTANFPARASDIFIVTYPKCGTTWVTQIAHQLRTKGHMDFAEITEVVPWDILALDCGQDLAQDQVASPRLFKSHEPVERIAKGARYIYVCRDPRDAFVSFYHFLPSYCALPPNSLTLKEFADGVFAGISTSGYIWDHMLGWWKRRYDPDVLVLFYEDLKENLPREVDRIARWMGYDPAVEPDRISIAVANSTYAFMSAHSAQFDERFTFNKRRNAMGIPAHAQMGNVGKVRAGGVGSGTILPKEILQRLDDRWLQVVTPVSGHETYDALRLALNIERSLV